MERAADDRRHGESHVVSNWMDANRTKEVDLICPKCGAANRPQATYVVLEAPDRAACAVCSHVFDPRGT